MAASDQQAQDSQAAPQEQSRLAPQGQLQTVAEQAVQADRQAQANRDSHRDQALARRDQILAEARAKAAEILRSERGIEAAAQAPSQELTQPLSAPVSQAAKQVPAVQQPDAVALITQRLELQAQETARLQAQAAEVQARAAAAEQRLAAFKANPALFLQDEGMSLEDWNARLINGGEKTPEQKMMEAVEARLKAAEARAAAVEQQLVQRDQAAKKATLITQLTPVLADRFPLVNQILGPSNVLDHLLQLQKKAGANPIDSEKALVDLENGFTSNIGAYLKDPKVAAKLNNSVTTPNAEKAVNQGPRTMTNRVTSNATPSTGRTTMAEKRAKANEFLRAMIADRK